MKNPDFGVKKIYTIHRFKQIVYTFMNVFYMRLLFLSQISDISRINFNKTNFHLSKFSIFYELD